MNLNLPRLARATVWLAGAHLVLGGLYWALLTTPETNPLTLTLSAVLVVLLVAATTVAVVGAARLVDGAAWRALTAGASRLLPAGVIGLVLTAVLLWVASAIDTWASDHEGAIRATLIARIGWQDATPLFTVVQWGLWWLRLVVTPLIGSAASVAVMRAGLPAVLHADWVRVALGLRSLGLATAAAFILIRLPWSAVAWRPTGLPASWVEPAAAAIKLGAIVLAMSAGWAVLIAAATRASSAAVSTPDVAPPPVPPPAA